MLGVTVWVNALAVTYNLSDFARARVIVVIGQEVGPAAAPAASHTQGSDGDPEGQSHAQRMQDGGELGTSGLDRVTHDRRYSHKRGRM